jgi:hypothetical protein
MFCFSALFDMLSPSVNPAFAFATASNSGTFGSGHA